MSAQVPTLQTRLDALWAEWLTARDKAAQSSNIQDGIDAGRAWSRWLAVFVPEGTTRDAVHGSDVVRIRK